MNSKYIAILAAIIAMTAVVVAVPVAETDADDSLEITNVTFDDQTVPGMVLVNVELNKNVQTVTAFSIVSADGQILSQSLPAINGNMLGTTLTAIPADGYTVSVTADNETASYRRRDS